MKTQICLLLALLFTSFPALADPTALLSKVAAGSTFTLTNLDLTVNAYSEHYALGAQNIRGYQFACYLDFAATNQDRSIKGTLEMIIDHADYRGVTYKFVITGSRLEKLAVPIGIHCESPDDYVRIGEAMEYFKNHGWNFKETPPGPFSSR